MNANEEAGATSGSVGDFVGLCIPVKFPDVKETVPVSEIDSFLNDPHYSGYGNNGSVFQYFLDNSLGLCRYKNEVTHCYTAKHPFSYYDDPNVKYGIRAQELVTEALESPGSGAPEFDRLTYSSDGNAHGITIAYAGNSTNQQADGLWAHQDVLGVPVDLGNQRTALRYMVIGTGSAVNGQNTLLELGPFCHETGHLLCSFPDLYDLDAETQDQSYGAGQYCLMAYGSERSYGHARNPVNLCAYLKLFAGWQKKMTDLSVVPGRHVAVPVSNEFFYFSKNESEYFLIENRQKVGRDVGLPASGLAIWHIDHNGSNRYEQRADYHYECALEQADGRFDLEQTDGAGNSGDAEDLFPTDRWTTFDHTTTPNSRWWDGTRSGLEITGIVSVDNGVAFEVV